MKIISKTQWLTEEITQSIRNGIYPDGTELLSEDMLAAKYHVSRSTVRIALSNLNKHGVIVKSRGKRSIVCASALSRKHRQIRLGWVGFGSLTQSLVYLSFFSELQKLIVELNGSLTLLPLENPDSESWAAGIAGSFDGLFLAGLRKGVILPELEKELSAMSNTVEIDDIASPIGHYTVCTDNYAAGRMAAAYLLDHRCKTAAFVDTRCALYRGFHDRMCGFVDEYHARRKTPVMYSCNSDSFEIPTLVKQVAAEHPEINTIWYVTDSGALAIRRIFERDFPGRTYYSAGVDGMHKTIDGVTNHLSLGHPVCEIAQTALQTMRKLLAGKKPEQTVQQIQPVLIPWDNIKRKS